VSSALVDMRTAAVLGRTRRACVQLYVFSDVRPSVCRVTLYGYGHGYWIRTRIQVEDNINDRRQVSDTIAVIRVTLHARWGWRAAVSLASLRDNMMRVAGRSVFRARATAGAGWGAARSLGGVPIALAPSSTPHLRRQLGAVWERRDAVAGSTRFSRGFACLSGGGCGGWGAPTATRALSSSSGDGSGGSSSVNDKLRLSREQRKPMRGERVGERATGDAARAGRGGSGASVRSGGGGGIGGRGRRGAGVGKGRSGQSLVMNNLVLQEECPERLLHLVADKLDNFDAVNVSTAFSRFGKLCRHRSFPRNIAADDGFRRLMGTWGVRATCAPKGGRDNWPTSRMLWRR